MSDGLTAVESLDVGWSAPHDGSAVVAIPSGMNVDPLLSLLVGALGAALLGLLGASIQARREHARWVRERRHEAYNAFMRVADRVRHRDQQANAAADASYYARIFEALGSIRLVGPDAVIDAAKAYGDAASAYERLELSTDAGADPTVAPTLERLSSARKVLIDLMRKELGMKG